MEIYFRPIGNSAGDSKCLTVWILLPRLTTYRSLHSSAALERYYFILGNILNRVAVPILSKDLMQHDS